MAPSDQPSDPAVQTGQTAPRYQVLARKYRPQTFTDLVGQDAMVRTLSNAFASGRVAHGFILTGVRGVGKTTTARIIAKGLNCVGPDGTGGPTITPCGTCEPCRSISESRNIDVLEMDAASRTGIDDIREIIESVRYQPAGCRYKIYIIDEVHMLSKAAFNGLLKTLEEPPPHVKFIFATTEIRKVPITVLSRCQRFDLRRIEPEAMVALIRKVAEQESATGEDGALALLARAAEGSARDAMSLLDQAISHGAAGEDGRVQITQDGVRDMLGLADRGRVLDLFEHLMEGRTADALAEFRAQYDTGADPLMILNDLLEVTHWLTRAIIVPGAARDPALPPSEQDRGEALAKDLAVNTLTRAWQILLKGLSEAANAPNAFAAGEMVLIRLGFAASLKTPDDLLKLLGEDAAAPAGQPAPPASMSQGSMPQGSMSQATVSQAPASQAPRSQGSGTGPAPSSPPTARASGNGPVRSAAPQPAYAPMPATENASAPQTPIASFEALVAEAERRNEIRLEAELRRHVHLVLFEPGRMEFRPAEGAPADLSARVAAALQDWTGTRWMVSVSNAQGHPTLWEVSQDAAREARQALLAHPLVKAAMESFPRATLGEVKDLHGQAGQDESAPDLDPAGPEFAAEGGDDPDDDDF